MKFRKRLHPDDLGRVIKNFEDTLKTTSNLWQVDYRYKMNGNKYHDMISRGYIIRDEDQKPYRIIAAVQDVTEIRNIRSALFQQELRHRQMLGQSIIKTQEEERNRWALELHDNVGQLLTVIKLYMEQMVIEPSKTATLLPKAQEMTDKVLNDIRQLSASMKPPEFNVTSLHDAIRQLLANIQRVKTYDFDLHIEELNEQQLNDDHKLMIFRVVQEQLNNIIKYAQADHIVIYIANTAQKASIEIIDDGKGFDTSVIASGIGLRNIRSRLQVYVGQLDIDSSPGEGCRLNAEFGLV
jgi:two-component system sensor histidine kinase UhpB